MKVTNLNSNYDAAVQSQQIDDAIAQKYDIIVLVYVNDQAVVPALTRAKAAGIPVVLVVTPLKKDYEELFTSYVGTDHSELGRLAGEGMVKGLMAAGKTKAQIVAVTGAAQQLNVQDRIAAFKAALAKHPGYELVAAEDGKWNTALTEKITGELLVRFNARGGVDGIFAMADNQATGAIQAVEVGGPQARRGGQGDRGRRQQLHERRHDQHQVRQAVRHRDADSDRRGRGHGEEDRRAFQRREDEEIRAGAGPRRSARRTSSSSPPAAHTEHLYMPVGQPILAVEGVTKRFGPNEVLKNVTLSIDAQEIRAICGENGAGKSTLVKLFTGVHQPDGGIVLVDGKPTAIPSPLHAQELGIALVAQELSLAPALSVARQHLARQP